MPKYPHAAAAMRYARQVVAGRITSCRWVRSACERQLYDLERWHSKDAPYYFDWAAAERACRIVEGFPHIKGVWAQRGERIVLEPWQAFVICVVFGWKRTVDGCRRFRVVYIECPRKNAKSTLSSAVALMLLACEEEPGALIVSAATARAQAKIVFSDSQQMARREPDFCRTFGVTVHAHSIAVEHLASRFEAIASEDSNLDGLNVHGAIVDELHAHKTRGVWDVLVTATGSRAQPLIWAITTAGTDQTGICYEQRTYVTKILARIFEDESYFGIIFTIDEDQGDDWRDEQAWRKANPNFGVSIYPDYLAFAAKKAEQLPSALSTFKQKHLDLWVNADQAWMPSSAWNRCADSSLDLEDFADQVCYLGIDLATRSDIASVVLLFPPTDARPYWVFFARHYLPETAVEESSNAQYSGWEAQGLIIATPGNVTDFDFILDDIMDFAARVQIQEIAFDPYQALPLTNAIQKRGLRVPLIEVRQTPANMTPPMKEVEALVLSGKLHHPDDPVMNWMMSNVVARKDGRGNMIPHRERIDAKIDGAVALLNAMNRALRTQQDETPDYAARGGLLYL